MIKDITAGSGYVEIHRSGAHTYIGDMGPDSGCVRYNTSTQEIEVFDGLTWIVVSQYINIDLTGRVKAILAWAEKQMKHEQELLKLAEEYPAVNAALVAFNKARDQLTITIELSRPNNE